MIYIDGQKGIGGGLGRYIKCLFESGIYDYIIGDRKKLIGTYPNECIIDKVEFENDIAKKLTKKDIVHCPANMIELDLGYEFKGKIILTLHDCIPLRIKVLNRSETKEWKKKVGKSLERADEIIAISENTKKDISFFYPTIDLNKIHIVYNGIDNFYPIENSNFLPGEKYYKFYIGSSRLRHKNFWRSILGFRSSKYYHDSMIYTSLTGTKKQKIFFDLIGLRNHITYLGKVSDQELMKVYSEVNAILFVSLYEGCGLPPLEAMKCGTVAICSDIAISHEIYGESVYYVNPYKIRNIGKTIDIVIKDKERRKKLVESGFRLVEKYSLENMYSGVKNVINLIKTGSDKE